MQLNAYLMVALITWVANATGQVDDDRLRHTIGDLRKLVALPNVTINRAEVEKNIQWLDSAFTSRSFRTQILPTDGNPLLFCHWHVGDGLPTILFYMHIDGQPVDPGKWDQSSPFEAVIKQKDETGSWSEMSWSILDGKIDREWRIFGRSAADDKAPIIAFLHTIDHLHRMHKTPACNIKVILDSEEEMGSRPLPAAVAKYQALLEADALIINDGPVHISGKPTLIFGCRGNMRLDLTVFGPIVPQHSGHYGNYAPNPIFRMSQLLSSMKDSEGRVLVKDYYKGINLGEADREILAAVPDDPETIHELLQIAKPEQVGKNYQEALQYPSLNARGILSGWVGNQARTIVPDYATVAIDMRLVPESQPDSLIERIKQHIQNQGYYITDREPTREERLTYPRIVYMNYGSATLPFRTAIHSPVGSWLSNALQKTYGEVPIQVRMMGGTVPISAFIAKLQIPAVIVPMVNADNNQHSPNENMRIGHLENAMRTFEGIMMTPLHIKR